MSIDPAWESLFQKRSWQTQPARGIILLFVLSMYHTDRKNVRVLDLGCGTGANTWYLAAEGYNVSGIDGSATAIEKCLQTLEEKCPSAEVSLRVGDLCNLPYEDNSFDVVIDVNSVTSNRVEDMQKIYAEAFRVLRPNGLLYAQVLGEGSDPCIIAQGTGATFVRESDLLYLFGDFRYGSHEKSCRPFMHKHNAVHEWSFTLSKPTDEKYSWRSVAAKQELANAAN